MPTRNEPPFQENQPLSETPRLCTHVALSSARHWNLKIEMIATVVSEGSLLVSQVKKIEEK